MSGVGGGGEIRKQFFKNKQFIWRVLNYLKEEIQSASMSPNMSRRICLEHKLFKRGKMARR